MPSEDKCQFYCVEFLCEWMSVQQREMEKSIHTYANLMPTEYIVSTFHNPHTFACLWCVRVRQRRRLRMKMHRISTKFGRMLKIFVISQWIDWFKLVFMKRKPSNSESFENISSLCPFLLMLSFLYSFPRSATEFNKILHFLRFRIQYFRNDIYSGAFEFSLYFIKCVGLVFCCVLETLELMKMFDVQYRIDNNAPIE